MEIVFVLFDGVAALDAIGPYEVLQHVPGADVKFAALEPGEKRTESGKLGLTADYALADTSPDVFVVPGGSGTRELMNDPAMLDWVRGAHETSTWTTSVCTGALILGGAGLLKGLNAATHWALRGQLADLGANPTGERVVEQGKIITAAGVSAGIDMALTLAARLADEDTARAIQLGIEYDPQPPFDSGSLEKARPEIVELVAALVTADA
jgi:putative intracellular protease/amidase